MEITLATGAEMLEGLTNATGQSASQTTAEWLAEAQFQRTVAEAASAGSGNMPVYRWDFSAADAFDDVVNASSAQEAFEDWFNAGGDLSSSGAASQAAKSAASPQTAIKGAGAGTASVGGLLSMSLPSWVAAAAPLLGVAVGAGLYELSPTLWTKISQTLLPWCYPDSQVMPVVTDKNGQTYIDEGALEALRQLFEEEGIGGSSEASYDGKTVSYGTGGFTVSSEQYGHTTVIIIEGIDYFTSRGNHSPLMFSRTNSYRYTVVTDGVPGTTETKTLTQFGGGSTTIDGIGTVYWGTPQADVPADQNPGAEPPYSAATQAEVLYKGTHSGGEYPEGTSRWGGATVNPDTLPKIEVYTDPEDDTKTQDFIPVATPTTPGQSNVPEDENTDPTVNQNPEEDIDPFIIPAIPGDQYPDGSDSTDPDTGEELDKNAPIPMPFPNPDTETDPDADPSQPDDIPPGEIIDIIPKPDNGDITTPNMPDGDPDWQVNVDGGVGGLVSVYNPTYAELQAFSQWLWVTYADATIDKIWNNPFDGVISLHELYATPNKGDRKYIKSGFLVSPVDAITVPNRYTEINCGSAIFPEMYGNYLDYSPYSKALCYLPFIGIVELNVDDIVGHAVNIKYRVDSYSGACIALIECAKEGITSILYQFSGNCSVQMPIAGGTQAAIKAAQISAGAWQNAYHTSGLAGLAGGIAGGIGSLLSGNIGGLLSGVVSGIGQMASQNAFGNASAVSNTVSAKSSVQHSGQFGESFGAMGCKKPYMIIKRPIQVVVPNYQVEYGYQAHKYVTIGACTGYLRCRAVHVNSARATDTEKHMIEQLLVEGVFVT